MPISFRPIAVLAFFACTCVQATTPEPSPAEPSTSAPGNLNGMAPSTDRHWTFSAQWENDLFANTDRDYTNGAKLSWVSQDLTEYRDAGTVPEFVYKASDWLPFIHESAIQRNIVFNIGQNMYTPSDTSVKDPDPKDRPYCGWLYGGIGFHNMTERWLDVLELNVGVIGPWSYAEQMQTWVHRVRGCGLPKGWSHQIGNEPEVNLVWMRTLRFWRAGDAYGPAADAFVHVGDSLGTLYTYANTGCTVRTGWNLPKDFGTSPIRIAGDTSDPTTSDDPRIRKDSRWGIHIFGDLDGRAVLHDGTLDGDLFSDSISVDKLPFVMDASFGASMTIGSWKISYAQVARSKEFKTQADNWHVFGSLTVSYTY
jgi:hypothetical protein